MNALYQALIDQDIEESEIECKIGEGWTLAQIWDQAFQDGLIELEHH